MLSIRVKDVMTIKPLFVKSTMTVKDAATRMKEIDCGVLPVGTPGKIVGVITDRDITLRVIAAGMDPLNTRVEQVMTRRVFACREDDAIEDAAREMQKHDVGRLMVTRGRLVTGIVNMTCLLRAHVGQHDNGRVQH